MNNQGETTQQLQDIINKGTTGSILLPQNPSVDAVAAGTALYLGLTKLGKNMTIASSALVNSDIHGSDKISDSIVNGGDNLVISFPYQDGSIDKVDYFIKDDIFNLVITPRAGFPRLDPSKVNYTYSGGTADFFIIVDTPNLNSLGQIYKDNQKDISGKPIINIDRHLVNDFFGKVNIVDKAASSTSQLALRILRELQIDIDKDIATNLYNGLMTATNNFTSYSVNADTFETAADLLKLGAVKKQVRPAPQQTVGGNRPPMNQSQPQQPRQPQQHQPPMQKTTQQSFNQPQAPRPEPVPQLQPQPQNTTQPVAYEEPEVITETPDRAIDTQNADQAPQDWLKPKIFRGGGGLV
jgi:hypothetical protein